jgi:hypothetical protein
MALDKLEIDKVNGLYKQVDVLNAEVAALKNQLEGARVGGDVLTEVLDLKKLVKELACKCESACTKKK